MLYYYHIILWQYITKPVKDTDAPHDFVPAKVKHYLRTEKTKNHYKNMLFQYFPRITLWLNLSVYLYISNENRMPKDEKVLANT